VGEVHPRPAHWVRGTSAAAARPGRPKDRSCLGEDRRRYADFYADYFRRNPVAQGVREHGLQVWVGPISYAGADAIQRDIQDLKAAIAAAGIGPGFLPLVAPSSAVPIRVDEYHDSEQDVVFAQADALNVEYCVVAEGGCTSRLMTPNGDDVRQHGPARHHARYREWAELTVEALNPASRCVRAAQPLPRVLGKLERPAQHRHPYGRSSS
jgi:5-methyltetrahydropteroyltriglutamate--homocysteine methyltransferase